MRLDINLATHPYEDAREFWARWGLGVGLLAAFTLFLLGVTMNDWSKAGRDRGEIARLENRSRSATGSGLRRRPISIWLPTAARAISRSSSTD